MKYKNILYCKMSPLLLMVYTTHDSNYYAYYCTRQITQGQEKILVPIPDLIQVRYRSHEQKNHIGVHPYQIRYIRDIQYLYKPSLPI
jgi:hypothetical protein